MNYQVKSNIINLSLSIGSGFSSATIPAIAEGPSNAGVQGTVVSSRIDPGDSDVALVEIVSLDPSKYILNNTITLPKSRRRNRNIYNKFYKQTGYS